MNAVPQQTANPRRPGRDGASPSLRWSGVRPGVGTWGWVAVLAAAVLPYLNGLSNGFPYDDEHAIVRHPPLPRPANVPGFFVDSGTFFAVRPLFDYETAADVYRACRRAGATPRSLADCLVAAVAINNDLEVLSVDRDMKTIAEHTALRLVKA